MSLHRFRMKPETRRKVFWVLMIIAVGCAIFGVANLFDYVLHGPKYNPNPIDNPQEKHDLTWGLLLLSIAYKAGIVALAISGVTYPIYVWLQARKRRLTKKLAAIHAGLRGGGTH